MKLGPWIASETVVVAVRVPEVPVIVSVLVPGVAVLLAVSVRVLVPVVDAGENVPVPPAGTPEPARFTVPAKPYSGSTVIVDVPAAP